MQDFINRRTFLQAFGLGSLSIASVFLQGEGEAKSKGKTVIVVGGGLAGLCSAYELRKRGFHVLAILEAQSRPGGRVFTVREGLKDQQYVEMGATRIADTHMHTLHYANEFKLQLNEFQSHGSALYGISGQWFVHQDGTPWPTFLKIPANEDALGADALKMKYQKLIEIGDPKALHWPYGDALAYDAMTFREYLMNRGMGEGAMSVIQASNGSEIASVNALYWLMTEVLDEKWDKTYAIAGGNDRLPASFAKLLGSLTKYESKVTSIIQHPRQIEVEWVSHGVKKKAFADYLVCAIPFSMLRDVHISPSFSDEKSQAVRTMRMMPVSRCAFQTKSRFWHEQKLGGLKIVRSTTELERIFDLSHVQDGAHGLMAVYTEDQNALRIGYLPTNQRLSFAKERIAAFWPQIQKEAIAGYYKIWHNDPFTKGAWSAYRPKEMSWMFPAARKREGRVFFCGEHTSPWSGWMQGALESAHRVVAEMLGR